MTVIKSLLEAGAAIKQRMPNMARHSMTQRETASRPRCSCWKEGVAEGTQPEPSHTFARRSLVRCTIFDNRSHH